MATIQPPLFGTLGAPLDLSWTGANGPGGNATIDGQKPAANFATAPGETITIDVDGGGPMMVTMGGGDNTAALVAAQINGTFAGLASVNAMGGIRLSAAISIDITAMSAPNGPTALGLTKGLRSAAASALWMLEQGALQIDRLDKVSTPFPIPRGANLLTVWTVVTNAGGHGGLVWLPTWDDGVIGVPGGDLTSLVLDDGGQVQPTVLGNTGSPAFFSNEGVAAKYQQGGATDLWAFALAGPLGLIVTKRLQIPSGAQNFRMLALGSLPDALGGYGPDAPVLSAKVWASAA